MIMSDKIEAIITLCRVADIEIVSYGLAPNPFGFCYEVGDTSASACDELDLMLDALSESEEKELRQLLF